MLTEHFGKPPETSGNPDEAVAIGAAIMGSLIQSEKRSYIGPASTPGMGIMRISDVCSHSLGMAALDEAGKLRNSVIISEEYQYSRVMLAKTTT